MPGSSSTGDFLNGVALAVIAYIVMGALSNIVRGVLAFFQPQIVVQKTSKTPFQVFLKFLQNVVILALIGYVAMQVLRVYRAGGS